MPGTGLARSSTSSCLVVFVVLLHADVIMTHL